MKEFTRYLDDTGRVTIPRSIRDALNLEGGQPLKINIRDGGVFIIEENPHCSLCGSKTEIQVCNSLPFCSDCIIKTMKE